MKTKKLILLIVCLGIVGLLVASFVIALISITGGEKYTDEDTRLMGMGGESYYSEEEAMMAPGKAGGAETAVGGEQEIDKKIIKTGSLELVVKKVGEAVSQITEMVTKKEGFVSDSNVYTREDKSQYGYITVRVPAKHFEETMNELKALAEIVEEESVSGIDVTEEFVDLQSRLKNLRIEEEQYQKIVQRAWEIEDVLNATEYLFDTREEIERIEGRIKYLENLTDLATIRVSLSEEPKVEIPVYAWKPLMIIKKAFRAMVGFWQVIVNILIWLVIFLVPLGIVVWIVYKIVKKIIKK